MNSLDKMYEAFQIWKLKVKHVEYAYLRLFNDRTVALFDEKGFVDGIHSFESMTEIFKQQIRIMEALND